MTLGCFGLFVQFCQFDVFFWKLACNYKNHVTELYTTPKHQDPSKTPFQLIIHPNNVHPIHNHSNTLAPCMHSMHVVFHAIVTKVRENAQPRHTTYHEP